MAVFMPLLTTIQQWTTRVTRVNSGIRLNKADTLISNTDVATRAVCGTNNSAVTVLSRPKA